MILLSDKDYNPNKANNKINGGYTPEEMNNKYRFQKRWQEKNGYIVKSYRLNEKTIKKLLEFSEENNVSQASVLRNAFQEYKDKKSKSKIDEFLDSITPTEENKSKSIITEFVDSLVPSEDKDFKSEISKFVDSLMPSEEKKTKSEVSKFVDSLASSEDKKYGVKKGFKITRDFADEIEFVCKQLGFSYGHFVTKILDDYMANQNKGQRN